MKNNLKIIPIIIVIFVFIFSCRQENFITDSNAKLEFSADTIMFDTVFSTIGSATKYFLVYNPHDDFIKISSVELAKGNSSNYRMNINGSPKIYDENISIAGGDSLFIFVEVTVDPEKDEMLEHDSIIFTVNGNIQDIDLVAFGQDINLINDSVVNTQTWTSEKPYLIYNDMAIAENEILTMEAGTHLHFHKNCTLFVLGTLKVNGTFEEPVIFEGDRLEEDYFDVPGQWFGIWITKLSKNNEINFAEIKNAHVGITIDSVQNTSPMLSIHNSKIEHHSLYGILTRISSVFATNCLIEDCGIFNIALTRGGSYWFYHCTIGNYWNNSIRNTPSVLIQNWYKHSDGTVYVYQQEEAYFGNCIIWGNQETEIGLSGINEGVTFNYKFDNCLLKIDNQSDINTNDEEHFSDLILNNEPKFKNFSEYNFELDTLSPGKDAGNINITNEFPTFLNFDLKNNNRLNDEAPDVGAFERIERIENLNKK